MSRFKIAFENESQIVSGDVLETLLNSTDEHTTKSSNDISKVEDAKEIIGSITEVLAENINNGQELDVSTTKVASLAVEQIMRSFGVGKISLPSLESYSQSQSRLSDSKKVIRDLVVLETFLDSQLTLSYESFLEDLNTGINTVGMSEESLVKVLKDLGKREAKEPKTFSNEKLIRYLNTGKDEINGGEIVLLLTQKLKQSTEVSKLANELIESLMELTKEVRGNWFYSNKRDIQRIQEIGARAHDDLTDLQNISNQRARRAVSFVTADETQIKEIITLTENFIEKNSLQPLIDSLESKSTKLRAWAFLQHVFRLKTYGGLVASAATGAAVVGLPTGLVAGAIGGGLAGKTIGIGAGIATGAIGAAIGAKYGVIINLSKKLISTVTDSVGWLDKLQAEDLVEAKKAALHAREALVDLKTISSHNLKVINAIIMYLEESTENK